MKKLLIATTLVAALTAGCSSVPATPASDAPAGSNQPVGSPVAPQPEAPSETSPPPASDANDGVAAFGSAYQWEDGLALTIGVPQPYQPGKYAATSDQFKEFVVFDVRIVNNTGSPWDPALIHATVQSANQEGDRVFDSAQLPPEPSTKLLNGREVVFKMAFGVADPSDLVLEVAPDWEHESVLFHD